MAIKLKFSISLSISQKKIEKCQKILQINAIDY